MRKVVGVLAILFAGYANAQTTETPLLVGTALPPGVTAPQRLDKVIPFSWPPIAVRCNMHGTATVELLITAQGSVGDATIVVSSGYPVLDAAAINSAKQLHYAPATKDGAAIAARTQYTTTYQLSDPNDHRFPHPSGSTCNLPPPAYASGLPPNFAPVDPPDSTPLKSGERLLVQTAIRMEPQTLLRQKLHVPASGETFRIDYSVNPATARVHLMVLSEEQDREAMKGSQSTGPFPLDSVITGRGSQSASLPAGEYMVVWLFADAPSDRIVSYREVAAGN
jgi:TonB family protein